MALGAATIFDVRSGGSDTANGGCFDPGQTAGMNTDLTVTAGGDARIAAPVVKSASYSFVAGDVNAWLYIESGTNWNPGWYQITSIVNTNEATLSAAIGAGYNQVNKDPTNVTTVAGVATVQTPTAGTWTIDYSQQNGAQVTYTDLASAGAGLVATSVAHPFGKQQVGNALQITGGTNFNTGIYVLASVAAGAGTFVGAGNMESGIGASGTGGLGGAFATPGKAGGFKVAGNDVLWQANGTTPYNLSSASANVAGGIVSDTTGGVDQTNPTWWVGWNTVRTLYNTDATWPILNANAQTTLTLISFIGAYTRARNIVVDGNSKASLTGLNQNANYSKIDNIKAQNCTVIGIDFQGGNCVSGIALSATTCSGTAGIRVGNSGTNANALACESYANTTHGFQMQNNSLAIGCISSANSGGSSQGFNGGSVGYNCFSCVAYNNGAEGFDCSNSIGNILLVNCIAEANLASGYKTGAVRGLVKLLNCGGYNNTGGNFTTTNLLDVLNFITNTTGTFFTNPGSGDFSLNNTANQGALARAAGFPGVMPRGTTTGYLDVGAVQHADPAGAAGMLFIPNLDGV